eukprot:1438809-Prymnesium_polylepis.1
MEAWWTITSIESHAQGGVAGGGGYCGGGGARGGAGGQGGGGLGGGNGGGVGDGGDEGGKSGGRGGDGGGSDGAGQLMRMTSRRGQPFPLPSQPRQSVVVEGQCGLTLSVPNEMANAAGSPPCDSIPGGVPRIHRTSAAPKRQTGSARMRPTLRRNRPGRRCGAHDTCTLARLVAAEGHLAAVAAGQGTVA